LHNNSDCSDKVAALEKDEADTAIARTTVLMEKISTAEILRMNSKPGTNFAFFPRFDKPSRGREPERNAQPNCAVSFVAAPAESTRVHGSRRSHTSEPLVDNRFGRACNLGNEVASRPDAIGQADGLTSQQAHLVEVAGELARRRQAEEARHRHRVAIDDG